MLQEAAVIPVLITANASGAGKDFTANFIHNYFGSIQVQNRVKVEASKMPIVLSMKDTVSDLFGYLGIRKAYFYEAFRKSRNQIVAGTEKTVVDFWVELGSFGRELHEDVWINAHVKRVKEITKGLAPKEFPSHEEPFSRIFMPCSPDWRFDRERKYLLKYYPRVFTIHVESNVDVKSQALDGELTFTDFDWKVNNDKTDAYKLDLLRVCREMYDEVQALAPNKVEI